MVRISRIEIENVHFDRIELKKFNLQNDTFPAMTTMITKLMVMMMTMKQDKRALALSSCLE